MFSLTKSHRFWAVVVATVALANLIEARSFKVVNKCPKVIRLFVDGKSQGSLRANGGTNTLNYPDNFSGLIYTDANGGNQDGSRTTRAGFKGRDNYYYEVVDSNNFNTEIIIKPDRNQFDNFCKPVRCSGIECKSAFDSPPTEFPPSNIAPNPPLYECPASPGKNNGYTITFCPSGKFPAGSCRPRRVFCGPPTWEIHPVKNKRKCVDVRDCQMSNGTLVQIYGCNGSGAQKWNIKKGLTSVRLSGTNFCLDAPDPANGRALKLLTCDPNLSSQQWIYTAGQHLVLNGTNQCVDLPAGSEANGNMLQTWKCIAGNPNQQWTTDTGIQDLSASRC